MLPRKKRVDTKSVEKIFKAYPPHGKEGKSVASPSLTFKFIVENNSAAPRISFIAPKSVAKLAVKRNLLRRRGYGVLGKHINEFPSGLLGVFIFKKYQDDILILENEIKKIRSKIN